MITSSISVCRFTNHSPVYTDTNVCHVVVTYRCLLPPVCNSSPGTCRALTIHLLGSHERHFRFAINCSIKPKSLYDWESVSLSVLVTSPYWVPWPDFKSRLWPLQCVTMWSPLTKRLACHLSSALVFVSYILHIFLCVMFTLHFVQHVRGLLSVQAVYSSYALFWPQSSLSPLYFTLVTTKGSVFIQPVILLQLRIFTTSFRIVRLRSGILAGIAGTLPQADAERAHFKIRLLPVFYNAGEGGLK